MFSWRVNILVAAVLLSTSCAQQQTARLTAEEAGWQGEVHLVFDAACSVGESVQVVVGHTTVLCGYGESCTFKTVPQYATHRVSGMPTASENPDLYWREVHARIKSLLPPDNLVSLHAAVLQTLEAQVALNDTTSKLTGDQRSALLEKRASEACAAFGEFSKSVMTRPVPAELAATSYSLSFQPVGTPVSFGVNSSGQFSVSFSESIPTPAGNVSFSSSKSTASPTKPKRLVIRSNGQQRVLFMDRDFEIWVPATHGVRVANTDMDFVIDVDARVPANTASHLGKKRNRRSA